MEVKKIDGRLAAGQQYILYGKMGSMKRFKPVAGSNFVSNLIHAEIFSPTTLDDLIKLKKELHYMQTQGEFEYRIVK